MRIGWFGIPGFTPRGTKTHVAGDGKVLCGWKPSRRYEFQWCAAVNWNTVNSIECERCRVKALKWMNVEGLRR